MLAAIVLPAAEISTGFLIGPKHDVRAFYARPDGSSAWEKAASGNRFKRVAQGKLAGVRLETGLAPGSPLELTAARLRRMRDHGVTLVSAALQAPGWSAYQPDGALQAGEARRVSGLLRLADENGLTVKLVLFHPGADETFDSPEAMAAAARNVTDWLIENNHRNVILSLTSTWNSRSWEYDEFVAHNLERLMEAARDRFQTRKTDFALPIALSAGVKLGEDARLVRHADVLFVFGEGTAMDPRKVERPQVVVAGMKDAQALSWGLERASGCILVVATEPELEDALQKIAGAVLVKPPSVPAK
jgi:hypothetical protein